MSECTYLLRTSDRDRRSYGGFQYPESGTVEAPEWSPVPKCGGGLHGLRMGLGDQSLLSYDDDATWQVLRVAVDECVDLGSKVKVPRAEVVYSGPCEGALALLVAHGAALATLPRGQATASGDRGQATASGYRGQATASGDRGQATASGNGGQAIGRYRARAGEVGIVIVHWWDVAAARDRVTVGYVGEDGIEPMTWYRANVTGRLVAEEDA